MTDTLTTERAPNRAFKSNPLGGAQVGQTVNFNTGEIAADALKAGAHISRSRPNPSNQTSLTGNSRYVGSKALNQGSISMTGSFGLSGVSQYSYAASAYVGQETASSSDTMETCYTVFRGAGLEYLSLGSLTSAQFLACFELDARQRLQEVLSAFEVAAKTQSNDDLNKWYECLNSFCKDYGDGIVAGVWQGGYGAVTLAMTQKDDMSTWQYGGSGSFGYASVASEVTVQATYDGNQQDLDGKLDIDVKGWSFGDCVKAQVDAWIEQVSTMALSEQVNFFSSNPLEATSSLASAPAPTPPPVPEFKAPSKEEEEEVKKELPESIQQSAANKLATHFAKAIDNDFNKDEKVSVEGLSRAIASIKNNDVSGFKKDTDTKQDTTTRESVRFLLKESQGLANNDYTPLGIFVVGWDRLFPWMSRAYMNSITDSDGTAEMLKLDMFTQDCLTLEGMYRTLDAAKTRLTGSTPAPLLTADDFDVAVEKMKQSHSETGVQNAFKAMTSDSYEIYTKWSGAKCLRNAYLGLGIQLKVANDTVTYMPLREDPKVGVKDGVPFFTLGTEVSKFTGTQYHLFAHSYTLLPIPVTTENGVEWVALGPQGMYLEEGGFSRDSVTFTKSLEKACKLQELKESLSETGKEISGLQATSGEGDNQVTMTLVNIPLDSAKGLKTWEGPSVVYNLSTNEGLLHNLEELEESLKSQEFAVTLSTSDTNWAWGKTWSPNDSFTMTRLGARYFGIVPFEGPNPFGSL